MKRADLLPAIAVLNVLTAVAFCLLAAIFLSASDFEAAMGTIESKGVPRAFLIPLLPILFVASLPSSKVIAGVIFLFADGLTAAVGVGLWRGKSWARQGEQVILLFCFVLLAGGAIMSLVFARTRGIGGLLLGLAGISGGIVWLLSRPDVKQAFGVAVRPFSWARWALVVTIGVVEAVAVFLWFLWEYGQALR